MIPFGVAPEKLEAIRTKQALDKLPDRRNKPRDWATEIIPPLEQKHFDMLNDACAKEYIYPEGAKSGKGIVIGAGGSTFFACGWAAAYVLRKIGCPLPIEFWVLGQHELDPEMRQLAESVDIRCVDALEVAASLPEEQKPHILCGWQLKAFALMHSKFEECLYLDADNIPVRDPAFLFYTPEYRHFGSIFWPDIPYGGQLGEDRYEWLPPDVWGMIGLPYRNEYDFESGQFLIDTKKCWKELNISWHINTHSDYWYTIIFGDKSSYHLAWRKCGTEYAITKHHPGGRGPAILQYDFDGEPLFQHAVGGKGDIVAGAGLQEFDHWHLIHEAARELRKRWSGIYSYEAQSEEETKLAERCIGRYVYKRTANADGRGGGERILALVEDGKITEGIECCEKRWSLRILKGIPTLIIVGEASKGSEVGMMLLRQDAASGKWLGKWSEHEKNEVELSRAVDGQVAVLPAIDVEPTKQAKTTTGRPMKFSIDMDGTLVSHLGFFRSFMRAMQAMGHQVGILTGRHMHNKEENTRWIMELGFPEPDFWIGRPDGSGEHGGDFKPKMIREHGIDYHFDDYDYSQSVTREKFKANGVLEQIIRIHERHPTSMAFE